MIAEMHTDPVIADLLSRLDKQLQEEFRQRIEQIEFQIDFPCRLQVCVELVEALRHKIFSQLRITCLRVELDGSTEFVLTTDLQWARQHLMDIHAEVIAEESIEDVIVQQYGGIAALTHLG